MTQINNKLLAELQLALRRALKLKSAPAIASESLVEDLCTIIDELNAVEPQTLYMNFLRISGLGHSGRTVSFEFIMRNIDHDLPIELEFIERVIKPIVKTLLLTFEQTLIATPDGANCKLDFRDWLLGKVLSYANYLTSPRPMRDLPLFFEFYVMQSEQVIRRVSPSAFRTLGLCYKSFILSRVGVKSFAYSHLVTGKSVNETIELFEDLWREYLQLLCSQSNFSSNLELASCFNAWAKDKIMLSVKT